jgi:3-deoxy-7-phosphoheptulonate synthase
LARDVLKWGQMPHRTDDLRIREARPLVPPAILLEEIPATEQALETVVRGRSEVVDALTGKSGKLVCVVGPCSIHDPVATFEYAKKLKEIAEKHADHLVIVMRAYFEKPRTSTGWKGLVNDPDLDESFHVNKGLRIARRLLLQTNEIGLPVGCEFLETMMPQYIADLVAWSAIGARTTESQVHRQLASGLSMPVGFKNGTDGNVQSAVQALVAASQPHWFPSVTKQGVAAIFQSTGNEHCHVILRGGFRSGPNYSAASVAEACALLATAGLPQRVMVDCSHGNSEKDFSRQALVAHDLACQLSGGSRSVFGVMLESNLVAGRQDSPATFGQSITDSCIGIDETATVLAELATSVADGG